MTIQTCIKKAFPSGLEYDDAAQLCLLLFSGSVLPDELMAQCTKENLPIVFSNLASSGFIDTKETESAVLYGANFHNPKDKGHWVEVIASIFKLGDQSDQDKREKLKNRLTRGWTLR